MRLRRGSAARAALLFFLPLLLDACGRKGPPLPPLVRTPAAPADVTAVRRGDLVTVEFGVPGANSDGTRPANVRRVDVYAYSGRADVDDGELLRTARVIGGVDVKAPRDPNETIDPDEPSTDIEPLVGDGLDQGARGKVEERLTSDMIGGSAVRIYFAVPITTSGRRGPISDRTAIPLVPAPPPPLDAAVTYDQNRITLTWDVASVPPLPDAPKPKPDPPAPAASKVPDGKPQTSDQTDEPAPPRIAYHVYQLPEDVQLTKTPVEEGRYEDARMEWGVERCYSVRTIQSVDRLTVLSDASHPVCVTLRDTFPPAVPQGLTSLSTEGGVQLIWDPNTEKDLAGYRVLRGTAADSLQPITEAPIPAATFPDKVPTGQQFFYAVQAVDKAGNVSAASATVNETAR